MADEHDGQRVYQVAISGLWLRFTCEEVRDRGHLRQLVAQRRSLKVRVFDVRSNAWQERYLFLAHVEQIA